MQYTVTDMTKKEGGWKIGQGRKIQDCRRWGRWVWKESNKTEQGAARRGGNRQKRAPTESAELLK